MLITAAPAVIASAIALPEAAQLKLSDPPLVCSATVRARAPGHTPRMPMPLAGAAATEAVAVPCRFVTGRPGAVAMFGSRVHSLWVTSAAASTSAISGLEAVTAGGTSDGAATVARQAIGGTDSGSSATWKGFSLTFGCAY